MNNREQFGLADTSSVVLRYTGHSDVPLRSSIGFGAMLTYVLGAARSSVS